MELLTTARHIRIVLPLACIAAVTMLFISEGSYWRSTRTLNELGTLGSARTSIRVMERGILDAEAAQRGYLLTGRSEYLEPYAEARSKIVESLKLVDRYYGEQPESVEVLRKMHALIDVALANIARTIDQRQKNGVDANATARIAFSDISNGQMDGILTLSAELLEHDVLSVSQSRNSIFQTLMLSRIGVAALSAISLLALFMYLRQTLALKKQQQGLQRIMQSDHDRLETEVLQRTAQLTELTHHLQTAREDERNRLARDLHDELGALLTSAKLDAARIKSRLGGSAPEASERLAHLVNTLNSGIALKRRIIEDLWPSTLSNLGLVTTLEILARDFAERSGVEVQCELAPVRLQARAELVVYRLVQEAVTNISKYAEASHVWVTLGTSEGQVEVTVRDDGVGFDTAAPLRSAYGLVGMRFRVEAEGGTLVFTSTPGQGTLIQARLPQAPAAVV